MLFGKVNYFRRSVLFNLLVHAPWAKPWRKPKAKASRRLNYGFVPEYS